jgi:uncharacterized protein YlxP (DUF503 family)
MVIGSCTIELDISTAQSLKDKRRVVKSVMARLRNEFNVATAEVGQLDSRQTAMIAVVTVSGDKDYAHGLLTRVVLWIERNRFDCDLIDYDIELI